eukprot:scaffold12688_cov146-Isochrysis_galbana.AAC.1
MEACADAAGVGVGGVIALGRNGDGVRNGLGDGAMASSAACGRGRGGDGDVGAEEAGVVVEHGTGGGAVAQYWMRDSLSGALRTKVPQNIY